MTAWKPEIVASSDHETAWEALSGKDDGLYFLYKKEDGKYVSAVPTTPGNLSQLMISARKNGFNGVAIEEWEVKNGESLQKRVNPGEVFAEEFNE